MTSTSRIMLVIIFGGHFQSQEWFPALLLEHSSASRLIIPPSGMRCTWRGRGSVMIWWWWKETFI